MQVKIAAKSGTPTIKNHNMYSKCMSGMHRDRILMSGIMERDAYRFEKYLFSAIVL